MLIPAGETVERWPLLYDRPHSDDQHEYVLNVHFLRFTDTGRVHVLGRYSPLGEPVGIDAGDAGWLFAAQQAICGARGRIGTLHGISSFHDDELCQRCYQAFPHSTDLLFEHPTPDD